MKAMALITPVGIYPIAPFEPHAKSPGCRRAMG